ncbi:MAG: NAD(+) diphosphatase [Rhodospirillales bacterium]|nr:NAD(+) diphosphatase [Rhodospirillales bacterium]
MRQPNFYAGLALDRLATRRRDNAFVESRLAHPATRLVPVWRGRCVIIEGPRPEAVFFAAPELAHIEGPRVFLGEDADIPYFALDLSALEEAALSGALDNRGITADLRVVGPLMERQQGALLAYARALFLWHSRHLFCGACGAPTTVEAAGHVRKCTDPACAIEHFPRTDPAVIMLVTHDDHCFLGRQKQWPPGMHSTLAGFVEPGESLEEAVIREVYEEAGLRVADVQYHSSQPWPFPASIMLGFTARAAARDYAVDYAELDEGAWFARDFLRQPHDPAKFRLPRTDSIAHRLIADWLAQA